MTVTLGPLPAPGPLPLADSAQPGRPRSWLCCGGGGHLHLLPQGDGGNDTDQYWSPYHHQATLSIPGYTESVETYSLGTVTTFNIFCLQLLTVLSAQCPACTTLPTP